MTTEQLVKERNKQVVFVLDTRSKSSTQRKTKDGRGSHLETAITFSIPLTGREPRGDRGALLKTVYVPGAPTRFIDDYEELVAKVDAKGEVVKDVKGDPIMEKVKKTGLKTYFGTDWKDALNTGKKEALRKNIHFKWGKLVLNRYGENAQLVDYLLNHEFCKDSPFFAEMNKVNKGGIISWHIEKAEQEAETKLVGLTVDHEVSTILVGLARQTGKTFEYDTETIDALLTIFGIGGGIPTHDYARKVLAITSKAKEDPTKFLQFYESQTLTCKTDISQAVGLKVIDISGPKAVFTEGKREFFEFKTKVQEEKYDILVRYLLSSLGAKDYGIMNIATDAQKKLKTLK